jgi:hypothetical protein
MSIKRSKQATYRPKDRDLPAASFFHKPTTPDKSWAEHMEGKGDDAFVPYALTARFDKDALIRHPTFGKGVVLLVVGARIEVLFEGGLKKLGHAG